MTFVKEESDLDKGLIVLQSKDEPPHNISLIPDEYVNSVVIENAIDQVVSDFESGILHDCAITDFLQRKKPRIKGLNGRNIAPGKEPEQKLAEIIAAIKHLDNSYLTIQGPPGSGKTFTGKHVIAELVKSGQKSAFPAIAIKRLITCC